MVGLVDPSFAGKCLKLCCMSLFGCSIYLLFLDSLESPIFGLLPDQVLVCVKQSGGIGFAGV